MVRAGGKLVRDGGEIARDISIHARGVVPLVSGRSVGPGDAAKGIGESVSRLESWKKTAARFGVAKR